MVEKRHGIGYRDDRQISLEVSFSRNNSVSVFVFLRGDQGDGQSGFWLWTSPIPSASNPSASKSSFGRQSKHTISNVIFFMSLLGSISAIRHRNLCLLSIHRANPILKRAALHRLLCSKHHHHQNTTSPVTAVSRPDFEVRISSSSQGV